MRCRCRRARRRSLPFLQVDQPCGGAGLAFGPSARTRQAPGPAVKAFGRGCRRRSRRRSGSNRVVIQVAGRVELASRQPPAEFQAARGMDRSGGRRPGADVGVAVGEAAHPPFGARAGHHVPPSRPASRNRPITIVTSRRSRFTVPRCMCIRNRKCTRKRNALIVGQSRRGKLHGGLLRRHLGGDRQLNAVGGRHAARTRCNRRHGRASG